MVRGHAVLLVAALLPVLRLAFGPAVAHELAAGTGAEGDAGLLGEAAIGALPAALQRLLRVGHVALRGRNGFIRSASSACRADPTRKKMERGGRAKKSTRAYVSTIFKNISAF